jgi:hypothetical protein
MDTIKNPSNNLLEIADKINAIYEKIISNEGFDNSNNHSNEWMTGAEVMKLLDVSSRTLQNYRDFGKVGFSVIGRRKIYYLRSSVEKLLKANYKEPHKFINNIKN